MANASIEALLGTVEVASTERLGGTEVVSSTEETASSEEVSSTEQAFRDEMTVKASRERKRSAYGVEHSARLLAGVCEQLRLGSTLVNACAVVGVSVWWVNARRREYDGVKRLILEAREDASELLLDKLRITPWEEDSAFRAKVKCASISEFLEKSMPTVYGRKLDVNVQTTVDLPSALERARSRLSGVTLEGQAEHASRVPTLAAVVSEEETRADAQRAADDEEADLAALGVLDG